MQNKTKVVVFESDSKEEIDLINSKLRAIDIETEVLENVQSNEMIITQLKVSLIDESKAFEIIDAYLQETE